jgi:hypothetical protein
MMGEVVGKAAWICVRFETSPRGVYESHLATLRDLMEQPGIMKRETITGELQVPEGMQVPEIATRGINPGKLAGIVIDDEAATLEGKWDTTGSLEGFVGDTYRYSGDANARARFMFSVTRAGKYEVRVAWIAHQNRAKAAPIKIEHLGGATTVKVNQSVAPTGSHGFQTVGTFEFDESKNYSVEFTPKEAKGIVHIDAVQIIPVP